MLAKFVVTSAVLAIAAFATNGAAAQEACSCKTVSQLQQELRNAITLRDRHAAKAAELRQAFGPDPKGSALNQALVDYKQFEEGNGPGTAMDGVQGTGKPGGAPAIEFVARGLALLIEHSKGEGNGIPQAEKWVNDIAVPDLDLRKKIEAEYRAKGQDLCDPQDGAAMLESIKASSICTGIEKAVVAHEKAHGDKCRQMGFYAFNDRKPAAKADDEVRAYNVQIKMLEADLKRVLADKKTRIKNKPLAPGLEGLLVAQAECKIAVSLAGRIDDLKLSGKACDVAEPFKLKGNYPVDFSLTPADGENGSYAYRGSVAGTTFWGSGNYKLTLDDGKGTLVLDGSGRWWAKNPVGTASKGGPETLKATEIKEGC